MRKERVKVYRYVTKCFECNKEVIVYFTLSDFGDGPIILHCNNCGEYYWYTKEDEYYNKSLKEQLTGKKCEKCGVELSTSLVPTHKEIRCGNDIFSLDDDFTTNIIPSDDEMVLLDVYLIYS